MKQELTRAAIVAEARRWIGTTYLSSPNDFRCQAGEFTTPWGFVEGVYRNLTGGSITIFDQEKRFAPAADRLAFTLAAMRHNPVFEEITHPAVIAGGDVVLHMANATQAPELYWGIVAPIEPAGHPGHIGAYLGAVRHYHVGGIWQAPSAAFSFAGVR